MRLAAARPARPAVEQTEEEKADALIQDQLETEFIRQQLEAEHRDDMIRISQAQTLRRKRAGSDCDDSDSDEYGENIHASERMVLKRIKKQQAEDEAAKANARKQYEIMLRITGTTREEAQAKEEEALAKEEELCQLILWRNRVTQGRAVDISFLQRDDSGELCKPEELNKRGKRLEDVTALTEGVCYYTNIAVRDTRRMIDKIYDSKAPPIAPEEQARRDRRDERNQRLKARLGKR